MVLRGPPITEAATTPILVTAAPATPLPANHPVDAVPGGRDGIHHRRRVLWLDVLVWHDLSAGYVMMSRGGKKIEAPVVKGANKVGSREWVWKGRKGEVWLAGE